MSSTETISAGRFFAGSPLCPAPNETSQISPRRGSVDAIAESGFPAALLGARTGAGGVSARSLALGPTRPWDRVPTGRLRPARMVIGTALDMWQVIEAYKDFEEDFDRMLDETDLTERQLRTALAYYERFPEEIDDFMAWNRRLLEELLEEYPDADVIAVETA
jgi:hypothetical protein